jgi:hypothetical protein
MSMRCRLQTSCASNGRCSAQSCCSLEPTEWNLQALHQPGWYSLHTFHQLLFSDFHFWNLLTTLTPMAIRHITARVEQIDMIHVRNVMVETSHPRHRALSSQRSELRGQMSAWMIGARIWIFDGLGTQVDDCSEVSINISALTAQRGGHTTEHQEHGPWCRQSVHSCCAQHKWRRSSGVWFSACCIERSRIIEDHRELLVLVLCCETTEPIPMGALSAYRPAVAHSTCMP